MNKISHNSELTIHYDHTQKTKLISITAKLTTFQT